MSPSARIADKGVRPLAVGFCLLGFAIGLIGCAAAADQPAEPAGPSRPVATDSVSVSGQAGLNSKRASDTAMAELKKRDGFARFGITKVGAISVQRRSVTGNSFLDNGVGLNVSAEADIVRIEFDGKYHAGEWVEIYLRADDGVFIGGRRDK